ncbi:alpha/beta fold hydrolase [Arthrobacter monumenti]
MHNADDGGPVVDLVLLHGWACPAGYWKPLQRGLGQLGHSAAAPPLPGYGDAPLPDGFEWGVGTVAELLAAEFAARRQAPVHLAGHSLGGSIAATIAARYPELVASVTLLGMVPTAPSSASRELLTRLFLNGPIREDAIQFCLNAWYGNSPTDDAAMTHAPFGIRRNVLDASLLAALDGVEQDVPGLLTVPVQVIIGAADKTRPLAEVQGYVDSHAGTDLAVIPGAGHMVHWEAPQTCAERIHALITP